MQPLLKQTLNPGGFRILEKNSKRSLEPGKLARLGSQTSLEERGSSRYDHLPQCWDQDCKGGSATGSKRDGAARSVYQ